MTGAVLSPIGWIARYLLNNSLASARHFAVTFLAGSAIPVQTYADRELSKAHANPIAMGALASAADSVWVPTGTRVRLVVTDSAGRALSGGTIDHLPALDDAAAHGAQTAAERAAGVIPKATGHPQLDPRRYGAMGDGAADDTAALNDWVAVVNATRRPVSTWPDGRTFLCGPLPPIVAPDFTWNCPSTIKVRGNSWVTGSRHIQIKGAGCRITGLCIDGSQQSFSAAVAGHLLACLGDDVVLKSVRLGGSCSVGLLLDSIARGRFVDCHFDSNAYSGAEFEAISFCRFVNCTFNNDGYGFKKGSADNAFQAFGFALRFRSHDCEFDGCAALGCGRDGMNTNQGSHDIRYTRCTAAGNGDGGFTIASDDTSSGRAGEGEPCQGLSFVDCESHDNWSSGLVAYARCSDVTVEGGRYYDNHRLAGTQHEASSYFSGIYFAGGSKNLRVRAQAYDDRQLCQISARSDAVIHAPAWLPGRMSTSPRVALYDAQMTFKGYGNIASESAGQVVVGSAANHGVRVEDVVPGWFVSQRIQHNGCFFDNACSGDIDIDGCGFMPGVFVFEGFKIMSGATAGGQNVLLPRAVSDATELLAHPDFAAGTGVGAWIYNLPAGGAANWSNRAGNASGRRSLQLVGGSQPAAADGALIAHGLQRMQGNFIEARARCSADAPGAASLTLYWVLASQTLATVVDHPGGGDQTLTIGAYIPENATAVFLRLSSAKRRSSYFDTVSLRVRREPAGATRSRRCAAPHSGIVVSRSISETPPPP